MNRFFIPVTATALAASVAVPTFFGRHTVERVVAEPVQTVVREIYHETPVYYSDTVYLPEEPAPVQPVYIEEHNDYEYNEYNHTDVYVREQVVVPPHRRGPGWSPRDRGQQPRDRRRDDGSGRDRNQPRGSEEPEIVNPQHPVKKVQAPINERQQAPVPPLPNKPVPPKRKAPVRDGGIQVTQVQSEAPKQIPTPSVDRQVAPASEEVPLGLAQARRK